MTSTSKPAKSAATAVKKAKVFSADELEAMQAAKAERRKGSKVDGESDVLAKIAEMGEPDRKIATRIHAIVKANAPQLSPKTWYGMPAYAKGDKVICFYTPAQKFKSRYATLGFNDGAMLDDGNMWPTSFALMKLTAAEETRIAALVKKAAG
jgi:uncharacterized protein YdhG (YjbR/CyaY superfamily)